MSDGASSLLSLIVYQIVFRNVFRQNTCAFLIHNRFFNTSSNTIINVAVNLVNKQSKYYNVHNSHNRFWYNISVNTT
jgi:hypothetical protein